MSGDIISGQFLSIIGPSGSGKTTLFDALCGHLAPNLTISTGKIFINNSPVIDFNQIYGLIGYVT